MARKIQVILTCDFDDDDTPAVETVTFGYNGGTYAFEACQRHLDEFTAAMDGFVARSRRESGAPRPRSASASSASRPRVGRVAADPDGPEPAAVREWARAQGFEVSDRGRTPAEIVQAYARRPGQPTDGA